MKYDLSKPLTEIEVNEIEIQYRSIFTVKYIDL